MAIGPSARPGPTQEDGAQVTMPSPLEASAARDRRPGLKLGFSLFWRTFFLLALLLIGCTVAWLQTFRSLEYEPRAIQTAHQIASLVNLTRAALVYSDAITRVSLIKTLADQEGVRILPREPNDRFQPYTSGALDQRVTEELIDQLGEGTTVASRVNDEAGLWIGFTIESDTYWLLLDPTRFSRVGGRTWLVWLSTAMALSLAGAALITRLINLPLKQLSRATMQVREGEYEAHRLDERARTNEIRAVNIGFNRMADQLAKIEQDRAIMLAGISHDLRTPLARLRLETEMSVADEDARDHMAADIAQLDAIIDKFLDYARPDHVDPRPVLLRDVVDACTYAVQDYEEMNIKVEVPPDLRVLGDEVELTRVISNLVENARRYGKTPATGVADVTIQAQANNDAVLIKVRDHGAGVEPALLSQLTKPFFRGDAARTSAAGAGLGLSIVAKNIERMGGTFALTSTPGRGLAAHIRMPRAMPTPKPGEVPGGGKKPG
ncbi:two-component system osmolarity sensor histidine kinase EnvZ [Variovorax boronicumulans]|uniref:histidine kinase n=2 Tax=Variovorax TaxID=34072 RepID=A0AAW8CXM9_9BURK|nr:two-component system osmolarity sensor histidine kinase EnvZ [Variovorax boronicumulans]MDQ0034703.1 two-component system osmolarity sensor histidine kinase EnvZ [Variovorax boronicumulans]MDQ0039187.1 two-component system osmolarity sensor histidine kinase EnvZ [Variovorax boronicumulans]MDQ0053763.1 two-component system osmolarity sensor histidine kinase EnvZ [Variovorax boronicumulans]MDQ0608715.1 two-component system osmolarity sensor histidine kinase EnvZ [Variovorax sp. W1I1]